MNRSQQVTPQKVSKPAPIRFQPVLPQQAHRGRSFLAWSVPATILEGTVALGILWATANQTATSVNAGTEVRIVELPTEVAVPKPPPAPELPPPMPAASDVPKEIVGFQELAMPTITLAEIPPPVLTAPTISALDFTGEGAVGGRGSISTADSLPDPIEAGPTFTPYTVAPFLKNGPAVSRALAREYPSHLREAGIGGQVLLWLLIDETGEVVRPVLKESSRFEALDAAAMRVAMAMEFSPAINRDRNVTVWVAVPVDFRVN
jgi:TonB family protein